MTLHTGVCSLTFIAAHPTAPENNARNCHCSWKGHIMGFYAKNVLPHLIDLAMRKEDTTRLHAQWVPQACADVREVWIGSA